MVKRALLIVLLMPALLMAAAAAKAGPNDILIGSTRR